ncbi:hypothetical protein BDB00DRAFT_774307 [Zychaea mexicana]|uniref:uncharacterized protein n=1 Tax=Zychaea mexicana TaxID=64656 RepID=UPI0022FE41F9|nr:uncharacterized protein BDB00DRAFT_774307 [Zychaea mexicana]KAI9484763.1 hypothetical protein BDB00DRAFT_774307 [Zychaea mexicana]
MMGYEFAQYVNKYLKINGFPTRSIAKIDSNPAKSKHLETATTKLFDQEVDFANLRTEVYEENSRIPSTIAFGTPTDDAHRRDITINSLFYNVNTKRVEDFTEKGLYDLQHGLVRTPLEPFETFRDDPLRVLRCVRFASRFNFELVPELVESVKNETIRDALDSKISRERIGIELEKMMTGPSPLYAVQMLHQLGLYNLVFAQPTTIISGTVGDSSLAVRAVGAVQWLSNQKMEKLRPQSADERRLLYLNSSLLPFLGVSAEFKRRSTPAVHLVLRDSIKFSNYDMNGSTTLFRGVPMFQEAVNQNDISRSELGMIIREMGSLWEVALKLSLVKELLEAHSAVPWEKPELNQVTESDVCVKYQNLLEKAETYGITKCYQWKTMLDGKKVASVLGIRPGPGMAPLLQQTMIWQLEHPEGTEEECREMIKRHWEAQQQQ